MFSVCPQGRAPPSRLTQTESTESGDRRSWSRGTARAVLSVPTVQTALEPAMEQGSQVCAHVRMKPSQDRSACAGRFLQTPSTAVSPSSSPCLRHLRMHRGRSQVSHPDTCPVTPPRGSLQGRAPVIRQCPEKVPGRPQAAEEAGKTGMPLPTGRQ